MLSKMCVRVQIICKVITGWRPEIPKGSPQAFVDLMCACW